MDEARAVGRPFYDALTASSLDVVVPLIEAAATPDRQNCSGSKA